MRRKDQAPRSAGMLLGMGLLLLLLCAQSSAEPRSKRFLAQHRDLVKALRLYLDPLRDHTKGWVAVDEAVAPMAASGDPVLADPDRLRWLTDQSRSFAPPFTDRTWQRTHAVASPERHGLMRRIQSEKLRVTWLQPRDYNAGQTWRRYPREDPRPWLITLHDAVDLGGTAPAGVGLLKRRWPYAEAADLYKQWLVLAPEAPKAEFVTTAGAIYIDRSIEPMIEFWSRYHVDFDRVILEGREDALDLAAAFPYLLAGLVLRGGRLADRHKSIVKNFQSLPVYVIEDKRLAAHLRLAGHTQVTLGAAEGALAWMRARRRRMPTRYAWDATHPLHSRSHWVQVEQRTLGGGRVTLEVESVDTKADPNTIRIQARGVRTLSLFLDDRVVDLDRTVRVVINGTLARAVNEAHATQGRDFKRIWSDKPFAPRKTRRYSLLFPAQVAHIEVPTAR